MWACGVNGVIRTHMTISSVRLDVDSSALWSMLVSACLTLAFVICSSKRWSPAVCTSLSSRPVVPGSAGDAMAPPDFGRSVNPISTKGGRLCPPYNTGTPGFSDLPTALSSAAAAARHYSEIKVTFPIWCTTKTWFSRMNRGRNNGLIEKFHFLQLWTRTKILAPVDFFDSIKNKSMNTLRHRRSWFLVKKTI